MRRSSLPSLMSPSLSTLIFCTLFFSTLSFAAAPDRIASPISAASMVYLDKSVHPLAQEQYDQGAVEASFPLSRITLLMSPSASQQRAIDKLLAEQQDPSSANFHRWLTPEQYAERFGVSQNDINRIAAWLKSQGFTVLSVARGRNSITFSGTAAQVQNAFQTAIHRYNVEGETHFANATPAKIPAALSGIVTGIRGLSNFHLKATAKRINPDYVDAHFSTNFLAPGDIATIYDIGPLYTAGIDGTGQTLAIVGQTDIYEADLADFRTGFSLSPISGCTLDSNLLITACNTANFAYILTGGTDPHAPIADIVEADLDIEWSGAVARSAQIIYVNSPDPLGNGVIDSLAYAIQNKTAPVISMSYGGCERFFGGSLETELQQANLQGQTIVNSSGDAGTATCDRNPPNNISPFNPAVNGNAVSYPASSPEVTGVGGTHVPLSEMTSTYWNSSNGANGGSAKSYIPEVAWNDDTEIATFCVANPTSGNCAPPNVAVQITNPQTAQEDYWIGSGGGGLSNCFTQAGGTCTAGLPQPTYQQKVSIPGQSTKVRYVPDVSLLASANFPGYIFCTPVGGGSTASTCANGIQTAIDTNQSIVGGTSASAPVFAGVVALLNQYFQGTSSLGLGNINTTLYALAAKPSNSAFHPVNTGTNVVYCQPGTPAGQPAGVICPAGGSFGFDSASFDATTHYNLATGLGSVDVNALALAWSAGRTTSSITVQAVPTQVQPKQSVTLTATVSPASAIGTVSFFDNGSTTALGTATLTRSSGGVGTFTWTTTVAQVGSNSITASYSGDGSNSSSTTAVPAVVNVIAPSFTLVTTVAGPHTVLSGQSSLAYKFLATPTGGAATFASAVTFSCAFAPTDPTLTNSSCAFSPTIAAGAGATTETLVITTNGPNTGTGTQLQHRSDNRLPWLPFSIPLAGVILVGIVGRNVSKCSVIASLCLALALLGLLVACGSTTHPITVMASGSSSSIYPQNTGWTNATATFTATLTNDSGNKGVTWAVSPANGGTIQSTDATHGTYTPPTIAAGLPASATITATSVADTSKTGQASINLTPTTVPGTYTVTVTAAEQGATSQSQQVTLKVQ